ncbi:MAG: hypothetical protein CDV28_13721 [Candidatus Electronema aureum]|uniref:Uncharacterized protein n=1 Tax=Candidatus Electronema aureum TaxID=2005002 RepID=A0A521FZH7_9BACT|nr:MAG: hypothetical protein CDV28_13721 [Candidatus Electronema aureum]
MKILKEAVLFSMFMAAFLSLGIGQAAAQATCGDKVWTLWAGQHINVGTVTVKNDAENVYVTYAIDTATQPSATFGTLHMWMGNDLSMLPGGGAKRPSPGQLPYHSGVDPYPSSEGLTSYTFTVPLASINVTIAPETCPNLPPLYVVTHAEVRDVDDGSGSLSGQTAFGGDQPGSGKSWWFYGLYTICCDFGGGDGLCFTETAFAKGTHIWTTLKQSNPENLPSLKLTNNRWGWAINLTKTGTATYEIWAGAGLNKTANGTLAGTLTVNWNGEAAEVKYSLNPGNALEEVHIYAADAKPTTVAPGQYGYPSEGYDVGGVQEFSYTVPLKDVDGKGGVWLIAHAVVSGGQCE